MCGEMKNIYTTIFSDLVEDGKPRLNFTIRTRKLRISFRRRVRPCFVMWRVGWLRAHTVLQTLWYPSWIHGYVDSIAFRQLLQNHLNPRRLLEIAVLPSLVFFFCFFFPPLDSLVIKNYHLHIIVRETGGLTTKQRLNHPPWHRLVLTWSLLLRFSKSLILATIKKIWSYPTF